MTSPCVVPANRKGGFVLIVDKHRYVRNRQQKSNIIWRCTQPGCGSYLHTNLFDVSDFNASIRGM